MTLGRKKYDGLLRREQEGSGCRWIPLFLDGHDGGRFDSGPSILKHSQRHSGCEVPQVDKPRSYTGDAVGEVVDLTGCGSDEDPGLSEESTGPLSGPRDDEI